MTISENMAAVRTAYRAFAAGNLDRFVESLSPGFVSRQSEAVPWRGTYRGREGVLEMFGIVVERADAAFEPERFVEGEGCIVVLGTAHIVPRSTGVAATVRELHVWEVNDGQLEGLEVFLNAPAPLLAALVS